MAKEQASQSPNPLDYASRMPTESPRAPISRITALFAAIIQLPWLFFVMMSAWGDRWELDNGPGHDSLVYGIAAIFPAVLGLACGGYSIWVAGFGKRNVLGALGMSIFGCEVLYIVVRAAMARIF